MKNILDTHKFSKSEPFETNYKKLDDILQEAVNAYDTLLSDPDTQDYYKNKAKPDPDDVHKYVINHKQPVHKRRMI